MMYNHSLLTLPPCWSKGGISPEVPEPTICVWTAEVLEHIAMHSPDYDVDIGKFAAWDTKIAQFLT